MIIKNDQIISYFLINAEDDDEMLTYRRDINGTKDDWEQLFGNSWEPVLVNNREIEIVFQEYCLEKINKQIDDNIEDKSSYTCYFDTSVIPD